MSLEASIITTYRCPMQCMMCNIWNHPTEITDEFPPSVLQKLPPLALANVTGGEPFMRDDLDEIIRILFTKTRRVVISTSGWFEDRVLRLAERFPALGFRVSLEGFSRINDELRGRAGGFDRGLRTLLGLRKMGIRDIGFGITVSDHNSADMLWLYELAKRMKMEFSTAALHNSYYFHKNDNRIHDVAKVSADFEDLVNRLMQEKHPKSWFRALFNLGLIHYIKGFPRILPCEAGTENFFIDPTGNILPCNGMEARFWFETMGNLRDAADFMDIWNSDHAEQVRKKVAHCPKNCWMIGSASPVMKKYIRYILPWVIKNKFNVIFGKRITADTNLNFNIPNTSTDSTPA